MDCYDSQIHVTPNPNDVLKHNKIKRGRDEKPQGNSNTHACSPADVIRPGIFNLIEQILSMVWDESPYTKSFCNESITLQIFRFRMVKQHKLNTHWMQCRMFRLGFNKAWLSCMVYFNLIYSTGFSVNSR